MIYSPLKTIEIHIDAIREGSKVVIVDDFIASGGTSFATCEIIKQLGGEILGCSFVVEVEGIDGRRKLENNGLIVHNIINLLLNHSTGKWEIKGVN